MQVAVGEFLHHPLSLDHPVWRTALSASTAKVVFQRKSNQSSFLVFVGIQRLDVSQKLSSYFEEPWVSKNDTGFLGMFTDMRLQPGRGITQPGIRPL